MPLLTELGVLGNRFSINMLRLTALPRFLNRAEIDLRSQGTTRESFRSWLERDGLKPSLLDSGGVAGAQLSTLPGLDWAGHKPWELVVPRARKDFVESLRELAASAPVRLAAVFEGD